MKTISSSLGEAPGPARVQPADLIVGHPELGGFIDVDLAGLLRIRLPELLSDLEALDAAHEDPSLAGEIRGAVETKAGRQQELIGVEHAAVGVGAQVKRRAFPIDLQAVGPLGERVQRGTEVRQQGEILIFAVRRNGADAALRRGANTDGIAHGLSGLDRAGCLGSGTRSSRGLLARGAGSSGDTSSLGNGLGLVWLLDTVGVVANWLSMSITRLSLRLPSGGEDGGKLGVQSTAELERSVGPEHGPLLAQPSSRVLLEHSHDIGLEIQRQLVVLAAGRCGVAEQTKRPRGDVFVYYAARLSGPAVRCIEKRRRRARRDLAGRVQDRVLDGDRDGRDGINCVAAFGERRDGRGEGGIGYASLLRAERAVRIGVANLLETIQRYGLGRRHEVAYIQCLLGLER